MHHRTLSQPMQKPVIRHRRGYRAPSAGRVWRIMGIVLLWTVFGMTTGYMVIFSPYMLVMESSISGNTVVSSDELTAFIKEELSGKYYGIFPKNSLLLINPSRMEAAIKERFPLIRRASIARTFPDRLDIGITEREHIILWCQTDGHCLLLNEDGIAVSNERAVSDENRDVSIRVTDLSGRSVTPGQRLFDYDFGAFVAAFRPIFESRTGIGLEDGYSTASRFAYDMRAKTSEGWEVYVNTELPADTSIDMLVLFLEKELPAEKRSQLAYVDLRTENRIYYALRDSGQEEQNEQAVSDTITNQTASAVTPSALPVSDTSSKKKKH